MKIFLTGCSGRLGTAFVNKFKDVYDIVGYDVQDGNDLLDYENLKEKMKGSLQVVHLAAIPGPRPGTSFEAYFKNNCQATLNVSRAATENGLKRLICASSTTVYGIERGIPFLTPITESQPFLSQYIKADKISCRDVDLSYHMSKVIAEQVIAWYGLMKNIQTVALRFGPINKVFLDTSVTTENALQAIKLAIDCEDELWYEAFSIVDETVKHIDISKAKKILGYRPEKSNYSDDQIIKIK